MGSFKINKRLFSCFENINVDTFPTLPMELIVFKCITGVFII